MCPLPSLLFCLFLTLPPAQEGRPPQFTPPAATAGPKPTAVSALQPGVLPKDATEEARAAWKRACEAALAPGAERKRVTAFQLSFEILSRRGAKSNETEARFLYLDQEGFIRTSLQSGREHVLGPDGPWLINGKDEIRLTPTRENEADLQQIDETISIARNFLALTDPSSLRIASLALSGSSPAGIPAQLAQRAGALRWLDIRSPDFLLMRRSELARPGDLFRVRLGLDPQTGRVEQAVIGDDTGPLARTAVLVELQNVSPLDGYLVPGRLFVFEIDPQAQVRQFVELPTIELWRVPPGTLQPAIGPDDFRP